MEKLIEALRALQASTFQMYTYSHDAHWNVEGILFVQFHGFFKDLYEDTYEAIDPISENIRKCGGYTTFPAAPVTQVTTSPRELLLHLEYLNNACIADAKAMFNAADAINEQGVANFAAERIDKHQFWAWWIKASLASAQV